LAFYPYLSRAGLVNGSRIRLCVFERGEHAYTPCAKPSKHTCHADPCGPEKPETQNPGEGWSRSSQRPGSGGVNSNCASRTGSRVETLHRLATYAFVHDGAIFGRLWKPVFEACIQYTPAPSELKAKAP